MTCLACHVVRKVRTCTLTSTSSLYLRYGYIIVSITESSCPPQSGLLSSQCSIIEPLPLVYLNREALLSWFNSWRSCSMSVDSITLSSCSACQDSVRVWCSLWRVVPQLGLHLTLVHYILTSRTERAKLCYSQSRRLCTRLNTRVRGSFTLGDPINLLRMTLKDTEYGLNRLRACDYTVAREQPLLT